MKYYNKIFLAGFLTTLAISALTFTATSENLTEDVIRMHVVANSDSDYDQMVKLAVKDEVVACASEIIETSLTINEAKESLENEIVTLEEVANDYLKLYYTDYNAKVLVEEEYFPTRYYDDFTLPAGNYIALKVMLGQAEGQNWWCVVYPSLCTGSAIEYESLSDSEENLITKSPVISFKIYEVYLEIKNKFDF
ncbi:MAG: stage II sporulation protein R [Clostridia bacterium]